MSNKKLLKRAEELGLEPIEDESDEDLVARINEAQNNREFDPTEEQEDTEAGNSEELLANGSCPDCQGRGIRNPEIDTRVCQTCEGSGKA